MSTLKQETAIAISDRSWPRDLSCLTCPRKDPFPLSSAMAKSLAEACKVFVRIPHWCLSVLHNLGLHVAMTCIIPTWFNTHHGLQAAVHCRRIGGRQTQEKGEAREQLGLHISLVCSISWHFGGAKLHREASWESWVFLVWGLAKRIA